MSPLSSALILPLICCCCVFFNAPSSFGEVGIAGVHVDFLRDLLDVPREGRKELAILYVGESRATAAEMNETLDTLNPSEVEALRGMQVDGNAHVRQIVVHASLPSVTGIADSM